MILITGATGNIGRELVKNLVAHKVDFKVMARAKDVVKTFENSGIKAVYGDFDHPESLTPALAGITKLFLLTPPRPDLQHLEKKVLEACKAKNVQHIVRLSAMGANPWSASALLRCHGLCEAQLEASGCGWTLLRPTIFTQNLAPMLGPSVAKESTFYAPAGEARMPFVDTRDIAAVAAQTLTGKGHDGLVYELTGPEALTYGAIAERLSTLVGRRVTYVDVPDGAAQQAMTGMGMSPWFAEGILTLYHTFKANGTTALPLDTVERLTGHAPRTVDAYLKENLEAFKALKPATVGRA